MLSMEHRVIFPGNEHHTAAFAVQGVYSGGEQIIVIVQPSGTFSKHGKSGTRLFLGVQYKPSRHWIKPFCSVAPQQGQLIDLPPQVSMRSDSQMRLSR